MKRLSSVEKQQLGTIIHFYRQQLYKSSIPNRDDYKQVHFCKGICSQAQLSRLENGDVLKNNEVYRLLLEKLNLSMERLRLGDSERFHQLFLDVLMYQNNDEYIINTLHYHHYIQSYQKIFHRNIIFTHYNYALEFIIFVLEENWEEASYLLEIVEETLDILPPVYLVLTLHHIGLYCMHQQQFQEANKYYLLAIENMNNHDIENPLIYIDYADSLMRTHDYLIAFSYLNQAKQQLSETNNHLLLARIYRSYSIIYLVRGYYDESRQHLVWANEQLHQSSQDNHDDERSNWFVEACLFYVLNMKDELRLLLKQMNRFPSHPWINYLKLLAREPVDLSKNDPVFQLLHQFSQSDNKEQSFHLLSNYLDQLPFILAYLIVLDFYRHLKIKNKYKKALEISEQYKVREYL